MDCIVLELEKEALGRNSDMEALLGKAYAVARKLKLSGFEEWIQCERKGYGEKDVPEYRMIQGHIKALNPVKGWLPVVIGYSVENIFPKIKLPNPMSELCSLYRDTNDQMLIVNLPADMNKDLSKYCGSGTRFRVEFGKNDAYSILNAVRNYILEWSLLLEENGIVGKDYCFSDEEKKIAQENPAIVNYTADFWRNADRG